MGRIRGTASEPKKSLILESAFSKFAFSLSILLTTKHAGISSSFTNSQTLSVPTSTPEEASTRTTAPSETLKAPLTSAKNSRNPGVSRIFIL